jgi:Zn-dependent protease
MMLACPGCGHLVHGDQLTGLAQSAQEATSRGDVPSAMAYWREALELLPADSRQYQIIAAKITDLGRAAPAESGPSAASQPNKSPLMQIGAGLGALGLLVWKLKAFFLGLTKGATLWSMLLSFGVYWTAWGWQFALGIVLSIYVHEMGHVIVLSRYGFKATAPMFIPGLGALVRLKQQVVNPREDAEIGLAGPIYGLGAALACLGIWFATKQPIFAAVAGVGAWINLFNLLPIGSLDGGRGFHAMSRAQKLLAAVTAGAACIVTGDGLLLLLALVGLGRALGDKSQTEGNLKAVVTYVVLVIALTAVSTVRMQTGVAS